MALQAMHEADARSLGSGGRKSPDDGSLDGVDFQLRDNLSANSLELHSVNRVGSTTSLYSTVVKPEGSTVTLATSASVGLSAVSTNLNSPAATLPSTFTQPAILMPAAQAQTAAQQAATLAAMLQEKVDSAAQQLRQVTSTVQSALDDALDLLDTSTVQTSLRAWLAAVYKLKDVLSTDGELLHHVARPARHQIKGLLTLCLQYDVYLPSSTITTTSSSSSSTRIDPQKECCHFLEVFGSLVDLDEGVMFLNSRKWALAMAVLERTHSATVSEELRALQAVLAPAPNISVSKTVLAAESLAERSSIAIQLQILDELTSRDMTAAVSFAIKYYPAIRHHNVQHLNNQEMELNYLTGLLGPESPPHTRSAREDTRLIRRWLELLLPSLPQLKSPPSKIFAKHAVVDIDMSVDLSAVSSWQMLLNERPQEMEEEDRQKIIPQAITTLTSISTPPDQPKTTSFDLITFIASNVVEGGLRIDANEIADAFLWCGCWIPYISVSVVAPAHSKVRIAVAIDSGSPSLLRQTCKRAADWNAAIKHACNLLVSAVKESETTKANGMKNNDNDSTAVDTSRAALRLVVLSMAGTLGIENALSALRETLNEFSGFVTANNGIAEENRNISGVLAKEVLNLSRLTMDFQLALNPAIAVSQEILAATDTYLWSQRPGALPPQLTLLLENAIASARRRGGRAVSVQNHNIAAETAESSTLTSSEVRELLHTLELKRTLEDPHCHWGVATRLHGATCAISGLPVELTALSDGVLVLPDGQCCIPAYAALNLAL